jgi:outer membrane protein assembly factor BamB
MKCSAHPSAGEASHQIATSILVWAVSCVLFLANVLFADFSRPLLAGDWPQILGPHRDGQVVGESLPDQLPKELKPLWSVPIGEGYAGPVVVGKRVLVFHREAADERLEAFDRVTGKSLWKANLRATYRGGVDPDHGPRCVPLVVGQSVYVFGAAGNLAKIQLNDGEVAWQRDLAADYAAPEGYFGFGSTPILLDGILMVNVGGKTAGVVGVDPADGSTKWVATQDAASYSSPISLTIGEKETAVFVTRSNVQAIDPQTGKASLLSRFGKPGPTVNAAIPLKVGDGLFVTASYNVGAKLLELSGKREAWGDDDTLSSQYTTPVLFKGYLFGTHGREDVGAVEYRCVDAATGKVMWSEPDWPVAHTLVVDGKLIVVGANGKMRLLKATEEKYIELGGTQLAKSPAITRAIPAYSDGVLFYRTNNGKEGKLVALPLK